MEKIIEYIESLYEKKTFDIVNDNDMNAMEKDIMKYIDQHYPLIEKDIQYVKLEFSTESSDMLLTVKLDSKLEDQLREYYPESLI